MIYETSYESGHRPFIPDTKRGYWANPNDFIYAGLSLAFRFDVVSITRFYVSNFSGIGIIPAYLVSLALYIVPLMVIQSFMGQFSSSGFISAFRLSPLFKGVGYVTLVLNICVVTYYSVFAMIPLFYMFASMQPTLPWSCEGFQEWSQNLTIYDEQINLCHILVENTTEIINNKTYSFLYFIHHHIPSVLYFKTLFHESNMFSTYEYLEYSMPWQLILCALLVWASVAVIIYKFFNTEKFGQLIRYSVWMILTFLTLIIIRFSFLPGADKVYQELFMPNWREMISDFRTILMYVKVSFGPGWGLFITLSSFNKFKSNIVKSSYLIGIGQLFIILALTLLSHLVEKYFREITANNYHSPIDELWTLYLSSGSVMSDMAWANLWSIMFFFMLFIASLTIIIIQIYTILTTIFDEFVILRTSKFEVSMGLIGVMAACSLYFTSSHGITYLHILLVDTENTQIANNLLLILIVLWIYGRVRFQRNIKYMINVRFSTWKIYILKFLTPLGLVWLLQNNVYFAYYAHRYTTVATIGIYVIIFIALPWLFVPGYAICCMLQSIGSIKMRFQRCCQPTDWYPVEPENRQSYEDTTGTADITHQLNEINEKVM